MLTRLFYTTGNRDIIEEEWDKPDPTDDQVEIKAVYTGICRSDIDMYNGQFMALPKHIQGHEGLGIVTKAGKNTKYKEGDYVATRGEPAFADYYNTTPEMIIGVPELSPKYIIEPVACAVNIAAVSKYKIGEEVLVLGTGFLAMVVVEEINRFRKAPVTVVGSANEEHWKSKGVTHVKNPEDIRNKKFKYIIDLSDKPEYLDLNVYEDGANIVLAAEKHPYVKTTFSQFLWKAVDVSFPSPRNEKFHQHMATAVDLVKSGKLDFESFWTKSYSRDTQVKQGFEEGLNREPGYSRGYISWQE